MNNKQFFIVGAQRSGTTYMFEMLDQHPEICMAKPVRPEPKYFLNKTTMEDINLDLYYNQYYTTNNQNLIYGEKSTSYYEYENVASLISNIYKNAKIIFCLRNPVERALSNYQFSVDNGLEKRTLEEVFILNKEPQNDNFTTSVNPFNYLGRGEYAKYIKMYQKFFKKHQLNFVVFENFVNSIHEIQKLYDFLEVKNSFLPQNIDTVVNESSEKNIVDPNIVRVLEEYYANYNDELQTVVDLDLSIWKK